MLPLDKMFKDKRTVFFINDEKRSKSVLFGASEEELKQELKHSRIVTAQEWDDYRTKGDMENAH